MAAYLPWTLFAMATYGLVAVFLKLAFKGGVSPALALIVTNFAVVLGGVVWASVQGPATTIRNVGFNQAGLWLTLAAVVLAGAIFSYYKALSLGPASVVVPIFALSFTVAATLGFLVLGEPVKITRVLGLLLAVGAIVMLTR